MDYYSQYNIKSMNDPNKSNHSSKITRLVVSVSVFAFLLSQSSLIPVLMHSYDNLAIDLINFKFKFFTYTTERNCIFLLCNGILLVIIQSSGLISKITPVISASKAARIDDHHEERLDQSQKFQEKGEKGAGKCEILEQKTGEHVAAEFVEMEEKTGENVAEEEEEEEEFVEMEEKTGENVAEEEEEEEEEEKEEEVDGVMCADELNKKCEEFIKKMKILIQGA